MVIYMSGQPFHEGNLIAHMSFHNKLCPTLQVSTH